MEEIICPNCHKAFKIDEAGYANIANQIRDHEFSRDLEEKIESLAAQHQVELQKKDSHAKEVLAETIRSKDIEIERLNGAAKNVELSTQLAVNKATEDTKAKLLKLEADLGLAINHETAKAQIEASIARRYKTSNIN